MGVSALCWAIWLSTNDVASQSTVSNSYLQVIFRGHIGHGAGHSFLKRKRRRLGRGGAAFLENTIMEFYNKCGWNFRNIIGASSASVS